jgi:hypothetical protein
MSLIPTYPAALVYEAAFNAAPSATAVPPYWVDITARTTFQWNTTRGRQYELDTVPAGQWNTTLDNRDGALDPSNTGSPFYPNVIPYRGCRIRAVAGVNRLTIDQATAGSASGYLGPIPEQMNVSNDFGYPVSIVTSGSAYQGNTVYQAVLPSGAGTGTTVLLVTAVPVVPGTAYSVTAQTRITAGTSTSTNVALLWYSNSGVNLASVGGSAQTLISGVSTWTALSASGQAPVGATCAYLKVEIASGSAGAQTTWQVDGLQFEQSATPTSFQMPQTVSQNLLPQVIATGSASMAQGDTVAAHWYAAGGSIAQANFLAAAPSGQTAALAWTTASGTTSSTPLYAGAVAVSAASPISPVQDCVQVTAGTQYTASVYLSRLASADATVQVTVSWRWSDANGDLVSTSAGTTVTVPTSGWVRGTCTANAPAGATWGRPRIFISTPATTTAQNTVYSTGWQVEAAATASTWADPGPTYYIYTGYIERWPQTWTMGGTYGQVQAIGVDTEALLAQDTLTDPFVEEVLTLGPNFFYQLNDPEDSSSCADSSANRPPAPVEVSPLGPGSLVFGSSITSTTPAGSFIGTTGPVATFANTVSGASVQRQETFINLAKSTVQPGPPTSGSWTRMIAFRSTNVPATGTQMNIWTAYPPTWLSGNLSSWWFQIFAGGFANINLANSTNHGNNYIGTTNLCDGNWHQMVCTVDATANQSSFYIDGVLADGFSGVYYPTGVVADTIGCSITTGINSYCQGFIGDLAHAIEIPAALTPAQITNLYNSFRSASSGESSGARAQRVLTWLGYTGPASIAAGSTANMGPANDLTGATGLDALNAISLTENGNLYVSNSGVLTFTSRGSRYNQTSPSMVFGEQAQWGEWPYEAVSMDFDPTHLFNDIQVTQYSTSQVAESIDEVSEALYYQRILQRTINPGLYTEAVDAADYLLQQYSTARMRISDITLHPAAVPGLFTACLQLEIGARIRVMRRPPQAPAIAIDCFVESINWDLDPDSGDVTVHLQCSPADLAKYWTLAALHTTISAQATAGTNTASLNSLPDAATNALISSLPQGCQLTFEPGTARQETLTIASPLPVTNVGYMHVTLTFTSNFAFTHPAGSVVCEPLPAGYTDPTTWDTGSVLGAAATTLAAPAPSGQNQITVGQLPDWKTNPLTSNWTVGDLLQIGAGTGTVEGYNLLPPNVSTAGEGVLPWATGTSGVPFDLRADVGTPTVTASATAFQGSNVWQISVAGGVATTTGLLYVVKIPATAGLAHTVSAYVRSATTGANPSAFIYAAYINASNTTIAQTNGTTTGLTGSPTAAWTRLTSTATAPAGTMWLQIGIVLTGTAPSSAWTFQADGLQAEQANSASPYQTCPQIQSVSASVAGYSTCVITLANNLVNNHAVGDVVCDPLPPGTTSPQAIPVTSRVAY